MRSYTTNNNYLIFLLIFLINLILNGKVICVEITTNLEMMRFIEMENIKKYYI